MKPQPYPKTQMCPGMCRAAASLARQDILSIMLTHFSNTSSRASDTAGINNDHKIKCGLQHPSKVYHRVGPCFEHAASERCMSLRALLQTDCHFCLSLGDVFKANLQDDGSCTSIHSFVIRRHDILQPSPGHHWDCGIPQRLMLVPESLSWHWPYFLRRPEVHS